MADDIDREIGRHSVNHPQASSQRKKMRADLEALSQAIQFIEAAKGTKEAPHG